MKTLLIFPPLAIPYCLYLSVPVLLGQLQDKGFDATGMDLNIDFYNDQFKKDNIIKSIENAKKYLMPGYMDNLNIESNEIKELLLKKKEIISNFLDTNHKEIHKTIKYIDDAVSILKSKKHFYNSELFEKSNKIISNALNILALPYSPSNLEFFRYKNPYFRANYNDLKYQCSDRNYNIFIDYYNKKIQEGLFKKYDLIGISIPYDKQLVPAMTLSKLLKENTNTHICISGNYINRIYENITKHPDMFDIFFDTILYGEGEKSIIELAKHIDNKIPINRVPNLVYKNHNNEIEYNQIKLENTIENRAPISLSGYNLKKYFVPEIIMPIQLSTGCYWNNCLFCTFSYGKSSYNTLSPEKVVKQIKELKKKYKIKYFEIIDESIHPDYYNELAKQFIKHKLNINYYSFARLEKNFSEEYLKNMYKSGLRMLQWGYESKSERIMKLLNKGIDVNERLNILKKSSDTGIWNHTFVMVGIPTETEIETKDTLNIGIEHEDIIHSQATHIYSIDKHSDYNAIKRKLNIEQIEDKEEFSAQCTYNSERDMYKYMKNFINKRIYKDRDKLYYLLAPDELLFLYICHYSKDYILSQRRNIK